MDDYRDKQLKFAYISPSFKPSKPIVFEVNEVLGLINQGFDIDYLICRKISKKDFENLDKFAYKLLDYSYYPSIIGILKGLFWCIFNKTCKVYKIIKKTIIAIIRQPNRWKQYLASLLISFQYALVGHYNKWDIIYSNFAQGSATIAMNLSELLNVPFTVKAHAFDIYGTSSIELEERQFFQNKLNLVKRIYFISEHGMKYARKEYNIEESKCRINRVSIRVEMGSLFEYPENDIPVLVAIGRLVEKKGYDKLIYATDKLLEEGIITNVEIYGDGELMEELEKLINEKNLQNRVKLCGYCHQSELVRIFKKASALVVPSVYTPSGDMDGIPTVIYEAMLFGRPVIASALAGIPEVIEHGETGLLVKPSDVDDLVNNIKQLLSNPEKAKKIGIKAREYVIKNHDHNIKAHELATDIYDIIKSSSN